MIRGRWVKIKKESLEELLRSRTWRSRGVLVKKERDDISPKLAQKLVQHLRDLGELEGRTNGIVAVIYLKNDVWIETDIR